MTPRGQAQSVKMYGLAATLAATIAMPVTAHYEGLRVKAYLDPVAIPTICFGETENVRLGDKRTAAECHDMLAMRLGYFSYNVDKVIEKPLPPETHAAMASLAYNIGVDAFKKSSVARLANEGKLKEACDAFKKFVYAGGKKLNGLVKRREAERKLCLRSL